MTGSLSFVGRGEDVGHRLALAVGDGVTLAVTMVGEAVAASATPVYLFAGSVAGSVATLRGIGVWHCDVVGGHDPGDSRVCSGCALMFSLNGTTRTRA